MFPRSFIVILSSFVTLVSSFDLLFAFPQPTPKITVINLYRVAPANTNGSSAYRQSLVYTDTHNYSRAIYTISEVEASQSKTFLHPALSPKKNFISTNYSGSASSNPSIFRVSDGLDIIAGTGLNFDVRNDLIWSPEELFFVINNNRKTSFAASRTGLFISYAPFTLIKPVMEFSPSQVAAGAHISNIEYINKKVVFTLTPPNPNCNAPENTLSCPELPSHLYSFTP